MSTQQGEEHGKHPRPRLETLSDLIYGLSLSIGAISLVITNNQRSAPGDINRNILEFLFVFLILITSWIIYTSDMSVLPVETRLVTFLNVILLILVAIIPYLFDQAVSQYNLIGDQDYASTLFAIDYAGTLLILAGFAHIISQEEKQLVDGDQMVRLRRIRNRLTLLTIIVLFSLAVPWSWLLFGIQVRLFIWYVPIISFWLNRMRSRPFGVPRISKTP
ncbi:low temperature requirement protein A [Candidatus Bathyarchaeota archaeon]|nr:MAG: low temperature requirement protein A [Candidatus Bathyarchaeota archaeon]